jgi:SAM-dependent methyltransferase
MEGSYLNLDLSVETMDVFISRTAIERALRSKLHQFHGRVLDIGAGYSPYRELLLRPPSRAKSYVGLDLPSNEYQPPDLLWDGREIPLETGSVGCALATELFEHCPDPALVMGETLRVLEPGGFLFFTVPFLWPIHSAPNDEYRYTPFSLHRHLTQVGFQDVETEALGGWDASLGQMLGLWVRRRPMSSQRRRVLSLIAIPLLRFLIAHDRPPKSFRKSVMITGLAGTATKPFV